MEMTFFQWLFVEHYPAIVAIPLAIALAYVLAEWMMDID